MAGRGCLSALCDGERDAAGLPVAHWKGPRAAKEREDMRIVVDADALSLIHILSYAVGGMEILELRENAENELGDAFSLKDFHKAILDAGPAPFSIVEEFVDAYIEQAAA